MSLAQHTAVAMARTGDWASSLLGGQANPVLGTEAGKAWAELALDAHSKALKAASAAGALASSVAAKAQAQVTDHFLLEWVRITTTFVQGLALSRHRHTCRPPSSEPWVEAEWAPS